MAPERIDMEKFMIQRAINRINNGIGLANENVDKDRFDENSRQAIGELQICKKALEKQIPKKPLNIDKEETNTFDCPSCFRTLIALDDLTIHKYCLLCGQALDWEE